MDLVGLLDDFETWTKREEAQRRRIAEAQEVLAFMVGEKEKLRKAIEVAMGGGEVTPDMLPTQAQLPLEDDQPTKGMIETANAVREMGGLVDANRLARKLRVGHQAAAIRLTRAAEKGLLIRVRRGYYKHRDAAEEAADNTPHGENLTPT